MSAQPLEVRMAHLEGAYEQISERLRGIDGRLTALDQKIDVRFDTLDQKIDVRFDTLDQKIDARFGWLDQKVDGKFNTVEAKFAAVDRKLTTILVAGLSSNAVIVAAVIGAILSFHHG